MKRPGAILLLFALCVNSFTFKTHYCYYADSAVRFHGDCEHDIKAAAAHGDLATVNIFPNHYDCRDIVKNFTAREAKVTLLKIFPNGIAAIPSLKALCPAYIQVVDWLIPEFRCRSVNLVLSRFLRGPPLV